MGEDASAWIPEQKSQTLEIAKVGLEFPQKHTSAQWYQMGGSSPHFRKGVSVSSWKNSCLPYCRSRAVWERERSFFRKSSANPRLIQKIIPRLGPEKTSSGQLMFFTSIWVIRQESCVQTWVRSTCTYVKESCLRKGQTVDTLHIFAKFGQPDGQWSWSWWSSGKRQLVNWCSLTPPPPRPHPLAPPHSWSTCIFLLKCTLQVSLSTQQIAKLYLSNSMLTFSKAQRLVDAHVRSKSLGREYSSRKSIISSVTDFELSNLVIRTEMWRVL